jgi:glyoxylase-like metal-dependent hydrolase (beta-lactamase superfamily II)
MEKITDEGLAIVAAGPAGDFANNIYVVVDTATNTAAFIDAPAEPEKSIAAAESAGVRPSMILLTHSHGDHTASIEQLQEAYGCALYANPAEPWLKDGQVDVAVHHGDEIRLGETVIRALFVPGHTPGSTTYVAGKHAFVGDTLFPGGPGHSRTNADLQQAIQSITTHLYALPPETVIYPGHGDRATIGASRAEYEVFASKPHAADLHGDVLWAES